MFIWAWGVNGCFSVIGAAAAPVIATNFGLAAVIEVLGSRTCWQYPPFTASSLPMGFKIRRKPKRGPDPSRVFAASAAASKTDNETTYNIFATN